MLKILIIAGKKKEFDEFIKHIHTRNPKLYVYANSIEAIRGCRFVDILTIGSFLEREDFFVLNEYAQYNLV